MQPTPEEIAQLKEKWGPALLMVGNCVVRRITLKEFDSVRDMDPVDAEDVIVDLAVIWPESWTASQAGEISSIANEVLVFSGFTDPQTVLEEARVHAQEVKRLMYAYVMATQTNYTEADLDNLTFHELAAKVALSENIIQIQKSLYDPGLADVRISFDEEPQEEPNPQGMTPEEWEKINAGYYNNPDRVESGINVGTATVDDPVAQKLMQAFGD